MTLKFQDMLLVESHEQDGSNASIIQTRNYLPGVRMFLKDRWVGQRGNVENHEWKKII